MRSEIKQTSTRTVLTACSARDAYTLPYFPKLRKTYLSHISQMIIPIMLILFLVTCDQTPTTLDEEPYLPQSEADSFSVEISSFEFDYLSNQFFYSIAVNSPLEISQVSIYLDPHGLSQNLQMIVLNDLGVDGDILVNDGRYDGNWTVPDSLSGYTDSLWTLQVYADDSMQSIFKSETLQPEIPAPPVITSVSHLDTLTLLADALVLDTLKLTVSHPKGLDEIRDVSMLSLKPDGNYANNGQPILLYDDGGSVLLYEGYDITSGDQVAGDGIYSLALALSPSSLSGTYQWTFNARTWLGMAAEPLEDSLIVLPAATLARSDSWGVSRMGVFQ
ncbi:MAG: hypothetical protein U9Q77_12605 [Candidatus Marinimicrobia bacterium]|nr:hypothetical protein [Candidatus Neomarinimicrobiota bacterium]